MIVASGVTQQHAPTLIRFLWQQRRAARSGLIFACARILVIVWFPLIFRDILDRRMPSGDARGIAIVGGTMVALVFLHHALSVRGATLIGRAITKSITQLRADVLAQVQRLSFSYLDRQPMGRLLSKYAFDTQKVEQIALPIMNQFIPDALYSLLTLAILITLNWRLSAILLLMLPLIALMRYRFFGRLQKTNEANRLANEKLTATSSEAFGALRLARSYGEEERAAMPLHEADAEAAQSRVELIRAASGFGSFSWASTQLLSLVVIAGGALLTIYGGMTAGTVLAFVVGLGGLMQPIQLFANLSGPYFVGREAYASLRELLDEPSVEPWHGTKTLDPIRGSVEFRSVRFRYTGASSDALTDFSLRVEPGERVAIVGPSGAGKSTVAGLLLGLYVPDAGEIAIDDVPLGELDIASLRRRMAIVMQESLLLSGTIRDNIRFARAEATDDEVCAAARRAQADEFVRALPLGYAAPVGERGVTLSGGQRQRLSIARAILRDPAILILDEPTSALDYESENLIQQALDELVKGRTVITIAHRLSTIRNADRIVVMEAGRVVEQGSFEQLALLGGRFTRMLEAQELGAVDE